MDEQAFDVLCENEAVSSLPSADVHLYLHLLITKIFLWQYTL